SDGLDVGDPDLLRHSMARLARRSAAVVWINPLLDTRGYEPIARGMSLARPHLAVLTSVRDPAGLRTLARAIASVTS
ncbi:MAG TPA: VWA domain-containing protein, partial [Vicinamibacterales bacterium]|nr:VWA domain-containing protein [Vicinamibacterales bacterium]